MTVRKIIIIKNDEGYNNENDYLCNMIIIYIYDDDTKIINIYFNNKISNKNDKNNTCSINSNNNNNNNNNDNNNNNNNDNNVKYNENDNSNNNNNNNNRMIIRVIIKK